METPNPSLLVSRELGRVVLRVAGCDALDEQSTPAVAEALANLPEVQSGGEIVLDLSGLHFATSTGLGALASVGMKARAAGGLITVVNASPIIRDTLTLTRLDTIIDLESLTSGSPP